MVTVASPPRRHPTEKRCRNLLVSVSTSPAQSHTAGWRIAWSVFTKPDLSGCLGFQATKTAPPVVLGFEYLVQKGASRMPSAVVHRTLYIKGVDHTSSSLQLTVTQKTPTVHVHFFFLWIH